MVNAKGALVGLLIGEFIGLTRLGADMLVHSSTKIFPLIKFYADINFLHFAVILFIFSSLSIVAVSFLTKSSLEPGINKVKFLFNESLNEIKISLNNKGTFRGYKTNLMFSAFIVLIIISLWSILY